MTADRNLDTHLTRSVPDQATEDAEIDEIVRGFLAVQARTAVEENRPLRRGTHAKGVCVRAVFEVLDVASGRDPALAARLSKGIFAKAGVYPATARFANSDPRVNDDWVPDIRGLSFAVDLRDTEIGTRTPRQDYSLQSSTTLPFNTVRSFVVFAKVSGAPNEPTALGALPFEDQLEYSRTSNAVIQRKRQPIRPYQQLRYWSNVPFRHGPEDVVKFSAMPSPENSAQQLDRHNPNALRDELSRHVNFDATMSSFDFALQFLDTQRMTYEGKQRDAHFWIENASVEWPENESPFHTVARLTLVATSQLTGDDCERMYFDVTEHSTVDGAPVGRINRARWFAESASRNARSERP